MLNIFRSKPATPAERGETVEAAWARREVELLAELHSIDSQLLELNQAAKKFRKANFAIFNGRPVMICDHMNDRPKLEAVWRDLAARTCKLQQTRHGVLEEWSRLKANREVRHAN